MAMLKQFAPKAVMPPSPKNSAWISRAIEMDKIPTQGPRMMLAIPIPTAWPVVPPGRGRLNIITTKEKAENTDSNGMVRVWSSFLTRRRAVYQNGAAAANRPAQVDGLR